ncbi:hypothetical protein [Streptomyces sp. NPDC094032]|uniref:hypothetical protein n=1 Tax=Streptomyces sp. NPDC094032 TaxID=3155308 RepID=UPI00333309BA
MVECALDRAETRQGLGRYRRQAERGTWAGAALVVTALTLLLLPIGASWATDAAAGLGVAGLLLLGVALSALRNAGRMRRALAAGPWSAHPAVAVVRGGMVPPSIVLGDPDGGQAWPLTLAATKHRYERVLPGPDGVLWWCGDPDRGGVIAPPGGGEPIWTRPVRGHHTRNRTIGLAAATGLFDRPAAAPVTGTGTGTTAPEPYPPTYAVLAAAARRQALPTGRPRREADVRRVAWWRVGTLRHVSGLTRLLLSPVLVVTGLLMLGRADDYPAVVEYAVVAFGIGVVLHSGRRFFGSGLPEARRLARAARAPQAVPKRYALLFDPLGGGPVLVLFPYGDGARDLPEAVVPLYPPGTLAKPRRGLPEEPCGPVELRGVTAADGTQVVVPWIGGRPVWPSGPYEELAAGDPSAREYLARLAPPQSASGVPAP